MQPYTTPQITPLLFYHKLRIIASTFSKNLGVGEGVSVTVGRGTITLVSPAFKSPSSLRIRSSSAASEVAFAISPCNFCLVFIVCKYLSFSSS